MRALYSLINTKVHTFPNKVVHLPIAQTQHKTNTHTHTRSEFALSHKTPAVSDSTAAEGGRWGRRQHNHKRKNANGNIREHTSVGSDKHRDTDWRWAQSGARSRWAHYCCYLLTKVMCVYMCACWYIRAGVRWKVALLCRCCADSMTMIFRRSLGRFTMTNTIDNSTNLWFYIYLKKVKVLASKNIFKQRSALAQTWLDKIHYCISIWIFYSIECI